MDIKKTTFLVRTKTGKIDKIEADLNKLGVPKKNIIGYSSIYDLHSLDLKTEYAVTLDEEAELSFSFKEIFKEIELKKDVIGVTLLLVINSEGKPQIYNLTPLIISDWENPQSLLDVTTLGLIFPVKALKEKIEVLDEVVFYAGFYYLKALKEKNDFVIIPKILSTLKTDEFDVDKHDEEKLHNELKLIMKESDV